MRTFGTFALFLLVTLISVCACIEDFDERTDSALKSISVVVDPADWYDEVLELSATSCEKHIIPLETDDSHCLRVTGLCYSNQDSLLSACENIAEDRNLMELTFNRLPVTEYCHIVVLADLVSKSQVKGSYEEEWAYLYRDSYSTLTVLSMGSTSPISYHSLYMGYIDAVPDNQSLQIDMRKASHNGYIRLTAQTPIDELYGYMRYPDKFLVKSLTNTALLSLDFSAPSYKFSGELLFPVTVVNFGAEITVSFSAEYDYKDVESRSYSVPNPRNQLFLLTIDCDKDAPNPMELKTF